MFCNLILLNEKLVIDLGFVFCSTLKPYFHVTCTFCIALKTLDFVMHVSAKFKLVSFERPLLFTR